MTTGRINQVTTVCPGAGKPDSQVEPPRKGARVARNGRGPGEPGTPPERFPTSRSAEGSPAGNPIAPTVFPRERSAAGSTSDPRRSPVHCDICPPRGGYQPPITPGGGYRLRRTSECLTITMAIGHGSTDSISAPRRKRRGDLRGPAPGRPFTPYPRGPSSRSRADAGP